MREGTSGDEGFGDDESDVVVLLAAGELADILDDMVEDVLRAEMTALAQ